MPPETATPAADPLDAVLSPPQAQPASSPPATTNQNAVGQVFRDVPQYETVEITDEAAAARTQLDRWKGRKNVTDRIAVLDLKRIHAGRRHFDKDTTKGPILCRSTFRRQTTKGPDGRELHTETMTKKEGCCDMLGEPRKQFVVPVLVYRTDNKGTPLKPLSFELKVWSFGPKIFADLQKVNSEHALALHDINVTCTEETFQIVTIVPCAQSIVAHPKFQEQHGESLKNWVEAVQGELKREIGRDATDDEIKRLLGEAPSAAAVVPAQPGATLDELLG